MLEGSAHARSSNFFVLAVSFEGEERQEGGTNEWIRRMVERDISAFEAILLSIFLPAFC